MCDYTFVPSQCLLHGGNIHITYIEYETWEILHTFSICKLLSCFWIWYYSIYAPGITTDWNIQPISGMCIEKRGHFPLPFKSMAFTDDGLLAESSIVNVIFGYIWLNQFKQVNIDTQVMDWRGKCDYSWEIFKFQLTLTSYGYSAIQKFIADHILQLLHSFQSHIFCTP